MNRLLWGSIILLILVVCVNIWHDSERSAAIIVHQDAVKARQTQILDAIKKLDAKWDREKR